MRHSSLPHMKENQKSNQGRLSSLRGTVKNHHSGKGVKIHPPAQMKWWEGFFRHKTITTKEGGARRLMVFRFFHALREFRGSTRIFLIAEKRIYQHTPAFDGTPTQAATGESKTITDRPQKKGERRVSPFAPITA
jgi:hypothetical protein